MKSSLRALLGRFVLAAFCLGCLAGPALAQDTIILGVAGAHSGDLASYGLPTLNAAKLVADKYNAQGGVLGKKIVVVAQDDQCKPEMATNAATKLVSDKADVILGHICSGATKAAMGIYRDAKKVCMSPSATNPPLTQSGEYPNFFRTIAPDNDQAKVAVDFIIDKLGAKKIAIIHDKGDYGKGFATFVQDYLTGKGEVVLFEGVTPGAVDYSAVVQKVGRSKPDCVVFGGYHPEASKIVGTMRKKNMDTPFLSDDGVKDDTFIKVAGPDAEGVYATGPKDISSNPLYKVARDEHQAAFGSEPGAFFDQAYTAALALLNAIEKSGGTDYDKLVTALRTEYVDTPIGKIKFDDKGDAEGAGFSVYQVQNGVYKELN
ncbi:MAG: branched-chain amino acid ABC transporter substrate-binding protein [Deltaproteobacteria bacterium]|nr:branched-chain amino acid ABC transporter substrate-binding protein [Deltaproteobacteria bacterium]